MSDERIIPGEELDIDAATIIIAEQRWEDNELLDTQEMADLFEACHRLRAHIAAQEAVIAKMREALQNVKEWEAGLVPEDGIRYGAYYPAFAVNAALALPNGHPPANSPARSPGGP